MQIQYSRRGFLRQAVGTGAGLVVLANASSVYSFQANEKLNLALIGVGGRGTWFVDTIPRMENVVAFCDVNRKKIAEAFKRWTDGAARYANSPNDWERSAAKRLKQHVDANVKTYADFRVMLAEMGKAIDGVIVATPDHTHAVASAAAIKAGKHVFCEKPLTRTVDESRDLRELARKHRVATSMGNQGTASGQFRRAIELLRDGTIGEIRQVHIWNTGGGSDKKKPPKGSEPVPEYLDWDLWLGPASIRPFRHEWLQRNAWRDFGTCQLGNWASHTANLAFMALKVHELWLAEGARKPAEPVRVEARCSGVNRLSFPRWELIKWEIPARAEFPPITFNWYNGVTPEARQAILPLMQDDVSGKVPEGQNVEFAGAVFVGTKGRLHTTGHNATFRLLPEGQFRDVEKNRPQTVDPSRGHEMDWLLACRGGKPAWASFDYADALNEFLMLGNVATQFEAKLDFDPTTCKITNHAEADAALRSKYRQGWTL